MMPIKNYILMVYYDFKEFVEEGHDLCMLTDLDYQAGQIPDYSDIHLQQLYFLRFTYAYAYEYKTMFLQLFQRQEWRSSIEVTSIGCGNLIDYWALAEALETSDNSGCQINYTGIDVMDWERKYKIKARQGDNVTFKKEGASSVLKKQNMLSSDVYIFPKSISEFSDEEFRNICNEFRTKKFAKQKVHILVSLRPNFDDKIRSEELISSMQQNDFLIMKGATTKIQSISEDKNIWEADNKFECYPMGVTDFLTSLNNNCINYGKCGKNCEQSLNRCPMLNVKNVRYQILSFNRKDF